MELDKEQIKKIAKLARLELSDKEIEKYGSQLSVVLKYVEQLGEVDTDNVSPTAQITGLENVLREDEVVDWDEKERENALNQAPELEDNQIKVRRVLQ